MTHVMGCEMRCESRENGRSHHPSGDVINSKGLVVGAWLMFPCYSNTSVEQADPSWSSPKT